MNPVPDRSGITSWPSRNSIDSLNSGANQFTWSTDMQFDVEPAIAKLCSVKKCEDTGRSWAYLARGLRRCDDVAFADGDRPVTWAARLVDHRRALLRLGAGIVTSVGP